MACLLLLHGAPAHVRGVQSTVSACVDEDSHCKQWSQMGECENNPGFMHLSCALTCGTCAKQRARGRRHECDDIGADAHVEGDITAIMESILQRTELGPEVRVRVRGRVCLLYTSPSPRDLSTSRMPSSA